MSTRTRSDFGTLADRAGATTGARSIFDQPRPEPPPADEVAVEQTRELERPAPVWVRDGDGWLPGIMRRWARSPQGWCGDVVMVGDDGTVGQWLVPAGLLRPGGDIPATRAGDNGTP